MRYWWVNHKQTKRQEIEGGYLWSPKREASGARSQFYDNMREAEPGDAVLSYADGLIGNVGSVTDFAIAAPKPDAFESAGANWSEEGWMLPVAWQALPIAVRPKDRIAELRPLLPAKYSPIQPDTGNGNQKAYLAEVGKDVFDILVGPVALANEDAAGDRHQNVLRAVEDKIQDAVTSSDDLDSTTKQQIILARHGQGLFRWRVAQLERSCRLTGVDNPRFLTASHIKPWRLCATAQERLDGANGLLLAPHVDRLFDRGFITFQRDGKVLVSSKLDPADLQRLGLSEACGRNCGAFSEAQSAFLAFHKDNIFLV
jgi:putative restriction endonuclease